MVGGIHLLLEANWKGTKCEHGQHGDSDPSVRVLDAVEPFGMKFFRENLLTKLAAVGGGPALAGSATCTRHLRVGAMHPGTRPAAKRPSWGLC